jgi:YVTN family beta-propeller protein
MRLAKPLAKRLAKRLGRFGRPWIVLTAVLALLVAGGGVTYALGGFGPFGFGDSTVGQQPNGSYLTSTNQYVTPAGDVVRQNGQAMALAVNPNGQTAADLTANAKDKAQITIVDLLHHTVLQQYGAPSGVGAGNVSNGGILYSSDGKYLWVAQTTDLLRLSVAPDGTVSCRVVVKLPGPASGHGAGNDAVPAGLAWAPNGTDLLVTLSTNNTLGVVDTATVTLTRQIPVGNVPNSIAVVGGTVYVSNEGGRPAQPGDQTNDSYGTPIVANDADGRASTGTVSEVDLATSRQVRAFPVGLEPTALLVNGTDLLVANSNDDTVSVIDTAGQQVDQTFSVNPVPGAPYGSQPNSLAMLDPSHLAISLGRDNAVAVYEYHGARGQATFDGLIPAGWFTGTVAEDRQLGKLVIASQQGIGDQGWQSTVKQGPGTNPATGYQTYNWVGTVQTVNTPTASQMRTYTQQVFQDNQWNNVARQNAQSNAKAPAVAVPAHIGDPSTIQHVFLIVKENRTYDQVLGDDARGNGAPALAQFGKQVTPNIHDLATRYPLLDNYYSGGTLSADGHNWLDQAFVNNYIQQEFGNWDRSYPASGADALAYAKSGFIWDDALAHGKSVADWAEYANFFQSASGQQPQGTWQQWYQDSQILEGKASGSPHVPVGYYQTSTDVPSLSPLLRKDYPNFNLTIPDQYRADIFQRDFTGYQKNGNLPALNLMWLPDDHTDGTAPGGITPAAENADNDLALGRIVDQISHSQYWPNTAIFVLEDDSQNGVDHVDGHRTPTLVISPYAQRGAIVHDYYTQLNVMRTIEQILGLPPMNQFDLVASPMRTAFVKTATPPKGHFTPFEHRKAEISLETGDVLAAGAKSAVTANEAQRAWAQAKVRMFAGKSTKPDAEDPDAVSHLNWYEATGFTRPYPGETAVRMPKEFKNLVVGRKGEDADGDGD